MKKLLSLFAFLLLAVSVLADVPFEPAESAQDVSAQQYYIYQPTNLRYVKVVDGNVLGNQFTGDKFIFVPSGKNDDCYYIYNVSEKKYFYYTQATGTSNTKQTSSSAIRMTTSQATANTWRFVKDGDNYDIVPGSVTSVQATTEGWNFRGGADYALNLYDRSDANGCWQIVGQLSNALPCATKVFSLPGRPFMHKLPTHEGDVITAVEGLPEGLKLYERPKYKYVYGTAPKAGNYTYTVVLNGTDRTDVNFTVSEDLAQPTPFMGILTWNAFQNYIDQDVIIKLADALGDFGLKELGYDHMCIDDCWATKNRVDGHLNIDTNKFPDMNKLVKDMHDRGLKIGIYSDAGAWTCSQAQPGSYDYEEVDAKDFVDWGFDLLKYDYCFATGGTTAAAAEQAYTRMGKALDEAVLAAGKKPSDFKFYMCEWGWRQPYIWAANTGASCWRATDDTRDFWSDTTYKGGVKQVIEIFKNNNVWAYQGVNRWNDADMLCVGLHGTGYPSNAGGGDGYSAGMTQDEYRTNFGLWCMFSSPLTLSNNITNLDGKPNTLTKKTVTNTYYEEDLAIIRNTELIALDQDPLGQGAEPIYDTEDYIVFQKDLANGDVAISITNMSRTTRDITVDFADLSALAPGVSYKLRDLWKHSYLNDAEGQHTAFSTKSKLTLSVPSHATYIYRIAPMESEDIVWSDPSYDPKREELKELISTIEDAYAANNEGVEVSPEKLITKNSQFTSPFTETAEGSLNNLLDGRADTFWHSQWKGVSGNTMDTHYLQVQLAEPVEGMLRCTTVRRSNADSDFVTRCRVDASTDNADYTTIDHLIFPFTSTAQAKGETVTGDFRVPAPAKYLRFYISETQGNAGNRVYGHFAEFQLNRISKLSVNMQHPEAASALVSAIEKASGKLHPSQEDIDELQSAYEAYLEAIGQDPTSVKEACSLPSVSGVRYDLQGRRLKGESPRGISIISGKPVIK
ncbi:MAG: discoidin domain-containing protein [Bacteroidaceae bacterium]|nr:discoidin domain-containing protein [Bacteroidaceae bacterium]